MAEYVCELPVDGMTSFVSGGELIPVRERIVRCSDCKHGHITVNGESCKWCDLIATHDPDGYEPNNGYDPEPYFDADFFCKWGERKAVDG